MRTRGCRRAPGEGEGQASVPVPVPVSGSVSASGSGSRVKVRLEAAEEHVTRHDLLVGRHSGLWRDRQPAGRKGHRDALLQCELRHEGQRAGEDGEHRRGATRRRRSDAETHPGPGPPWSFLATGECAQCRVACYRSRCARLTPFSPRKSRVLHPSRRWRDGWRDPRRAPSSCARSC